MCYKQSMNNNISYLLTYFKKMYFSCTQYAWGPNNVAKSLNPGRHLFLSIGVKKQL